MNVIEFANSLHFLLTPVQGFVLKLMHGVELSDTTSISFEHPITGVRRTLTETDYLRFLHGEGRCNVGDQQDLGSSWQSVLVKGRRSGATTLAGMIGLHAVHELLTKGDPQSYFGFPPGNVIQVLLLSFSKEASTHLMSELRYLLSCGGEDSICSQLVLGQLISTIDFRSPSCPPPPSGSIPRAQVRLTSRGSDSRALRGLGIHTAVLDEMAWMQDQNAVYAAVSPAMAAFCPRGEKGVPAGPLESRLVAMSTPNGREGGFFRMHERGIELKQGLVLRLPTWEMNPSIASSFYQEEHRRDPHLFRSEYQAEFIDREILTP